MWGLSIAHWIIVVGIGTLLFGSSRIGPMMTDLGKTLKQIKKLPGELEG